MLESVVLELAESSLVPAVVEETVSFLESNLAISASSAAASAKRATTAKTATNFMILGIFEISGFSYLLRGICTCNLDTE